MSPALCRQIAGLDDLARIFFPDNHNHRKAFVALWIEIKHGEGQFLASRVDLPGRYNLSRRAVEIVRAKLKKMGILKRVSHFDPAYGNNSGWTFSDRFSGALSALGDAMRTLRTPPNRPQDRLKDEQALLFL